ncbi:MAG: hypothetical protein ABSG53_09195 [Thermoguttaceae bacterium]
MKKYRWVVRLAFAVGFGLCWAPALQAAISNAYVYQGDTLEFSFQSAQSEFVYNGESGGEFKATDITQGTTFYTFCADPTQSMSLNTPYYVSKVSSSNAASPAQTLGLFSQWIYYQFRLGDTTTGTTSQYVPGHATGLDAGTITVPDAFTVNHVTYTANANEFAGAIQEAIWSGLTPPKNLFANPSNPVNTAFSDATIAAVIAAWNTDFANEQAAYAGNLKNAAAEDYTNFISAEPNILIAQLTDSNGNPVQNQMILTYTDTPFGGIGGPVPEPVSIAIWGVGAGLAGAAALRRRKQPRGRWSEENRQAIFQVIEGKR